MDVVLRFQSQEWTVKNEMNHQQCFSPCQGRPWEPEPLPPPVHYCMQLHNRRVCTHSLKLPAPPASPENVDIDTDRQSVMPILSVFRNMVCLNKHLYLSWTTLPCAKSNHRHLLSCWQNHEGTHVPTLRSWQIRGVYEVFTYPPSYGSGPCSSPVIMTKS